MATCPKCGSEVKLAEKCEKCGADLTHLVEAAKTATIWESIRPYVFYIFVALSAIFALQNELTKAAVALFIALLWTRHFDALLARILSR